MRVILHIGQHKTGSKALQSALFANRSFLREHGYLYPIRRGWRRPQPQAMNHHALFQALRQALDSPEPPQVATKALQRELAWLLDPRRSDDSDSHSDSVILSSEDLFDLHTAHETEFREQRIADGSRLLARCLADFHCAVTVMVYLRRQDHLLAAHYGQAIKGTLAHPDFSAFQHAFEPRLASEAILRHWERAFGPEAIRVAAYEREAMPEGIVADFCRQALGIGPPPRPLPFPGHPEAINRTPCREQLDYIRALNRRTSHGLAVLPRAQVLAAAFADRSRRPAGISAWLSPVQRAALLARHREGNSGIAQRHGLAIGLFREPSPDPDAAWMPPPAPDLQRWLRLDQQARDASAPGPAWRHLRSGIGRLLRGRSVLWIVPPAAAAPDQQLAIHLFQGLAGDPERRSRILPSLRRAPRRVALVVLVGPPPGDAGTIRCLQHLRRRRVPVLLLRGGASASRGNPAEGPAVVPRGDRGEGPAGPGATSAGGPARDGLPSVDAVIDAVISVDPSLGEWPSPLTLTAWLDG
jgi:hypothetical protein